MSFFRKAVDKLKSLLDGKKEDHEIKQEKDFRDAIKRAIEEIAAVEDIDMSDNFDFPQEVTPEKPKNDKTLRLYREYLPHGTRGELVFPSGKTILTLENPWIDNKNNISCIPEGEYTVGIRPSAIVERTSKGKYKQGWEIQNVPNRTLIMFHIGNYIRDTDGCVLTGKTRDILGQEPVVWNSGVAFDEFMKLMAQEGIERIIIQEAPK